MHDMALFVDIARYLLVVFLPLLFLYIIYLMVTKAFRDMGFSTFEAVTIIFISFLLGSGFLDGFVGFTFSSQIPTTWIERTLRNQVMFGSNYPRIETVKMVDAVSSLGFSEGAAGLIFEENARRFMNL